jgi:hypothetical protein
LGLSPNWKKITIDGKKWWQQGTVALSIEKTEAYIRLGNPPSSSLDTDPPPDSSTGHDAKRNEEISAFFTGARHERETGAPPAFACYVPASETTGLIHRLGIPFDITLQNITLSAFAEPLAGTSFSSALSLKTRSPSEAKALSAILSLARATIGKRIPPNAANTFLTELLFANPPAIDGNTVIIRGALPLDALIHVIKNR